MQKNNIKFPLSNERIRFLKFVEDAHRHLTIDGKPQLRKYTKEPYHLHPIAVANLLMDYGYSGIMIDIALGHDLFEDTLVTPEWLEHVLFKFGYKLNFIDIILQGIGDLTDFYTKDEYPNLNRAQRKIKESKRLSEITPLMQTIKYCDNIDNAKSIEERDPDFAKTYFKEMRENLKTMNNGDERLYKRINEIVNQYFLKNPEN